MKQLKLILIGGGDRGNCYLKYLQLYPEKFRLIAIAEPVKEKREYIKKLYNVSEDMCFESYEDLFNMPKFADVVLICTKEKLHYGPCMKAIEKGYDLLLEKPIAPTAKECLEISVAATSRGIKVLVCHVLRYTDFYKFIKEFIKSGKAGRVINVNHTEAAGNVHTSHSYVRGSCGKVSESAPLILTKCCHDTDLLQWLIGEPCTKVQSFGTQSFFNSKNAPEGAPMRCMDGCPHKDTCYYYAPDLYKIDTVEVEHFRAIVANKFEPTDEEVDEALKTSPYGRCVYHCDNDVVDNQIVNMEFDDDRHATLTMSGFNEGGRVTTFMCEKGELRADIENSSIEFYDFATRKTTQIYKEHQTDGHSGGDAGIMEDLYEYVANGVASDSVSDISVSCLSHLVCFAAEESRLTDSVIDIKKYTEAAVGK